MHYSKHLYLSTGLKQKQGKIICKLEQGKFQLSIHLIVLSKNEKNQLEIINSVLLLQKEFPKEDYFVVGIGENYEGAIELVEKITKEVYDKTKGADIRAFITKREQDG